MWQRIQGWFKEESEAIDITGRVAALWPVDMHNHLLPGVDDGVQTLDESLLCLRQYAEWGVRQVIATPHISQDYYPNTASELQMAAERVQQAIAEAQLPIEFGLAAEYLLDEQFDQRLQQGDLLCFGQKRFVLIETGWAAAPRQLDNWLFEMQLKGYTPVLAHPERYAYYQSQPHRLLQLYEHGCLLQLNLMSLVGRYGSRAQKLGQTLLRERCISFLGSDLHREADLRQLQTVFASAAWTADLAEQPLLNAQL